MSENPRSLSDADIVIRMLYYCEEPRLPAQIMSYCWIDRSQFLRFSDHCIRRKLLKPISMEDDLLGLVITEHGRETLATAQEIMEALGIKDDESIPPLIE